MTEVPAIRRLLELSPPDCAKFSAACKPFPLALVLVQPFFRPRPVPPDSKQGILLPDAEEALAAAQVTAEVVLKLSRAQYDTNILRLINGSAQRVGVLFDEDDRLEETWAKLNHSTRFWTAVPTHVMSGVPIDDETLVGIGEKLRTLGIGGAQVCGAVFDTEGVLGNPPSLGPVGYIFAALWASRRLRTVTMGVQTTLSMVEGNKIPLG